MNSKFAGGRNFDEHDHVTVFLLGLAAVREVLGHERQRLDRGRFREAMRHAFDYLDATMTQITDRAEEEGRSIKCSAGCTFCCYQHINLSSAQVMSIALWMREREEAGEGSWSRERIGAVARRVAGMTHETRYQMGIACPLLVDKRCSIYPVRPEACRAHFSLSKFACQRAWERRSKRLPEGAYRKQIPWLGTSKEFAIDFVFGVDFAVWQISQAQMVQVDLAAGLERALAPDAFERWIAGEALFEEVPLKNLPGETDIYLRALINFNALAADYVRRGDYRGIVEVAEAQDG